MPAADFWREQRVFLTGHTGFKGGWLALWLQQLGAQVYGFALTAPTKPNLYELLHQDTSRSVIGDIRDIQAVKAAMNEARPTVVIHMAAQPLVRQSYLDPVDTYATNVMGTVHVLEAARACPGVRAVLVVTSDKCYENREWPWGYRESDPMGGFDPYSSSKGCAELVVSAYRSSFFSLTTHNQHGVALATARAGNVIGGGDWASDRLVPDLLAAFRAGLSANIRNPAAVRPWQHVLEPLSGYLMLAQRLVEDGAHFGEAWNFGPTESDTRPVGWIAEQLALAWGNSARWHTDSRIHPHEANSLKLDCAKARQSLDWQPRWSLARALTGIVDWHKAHDLGADMRAFSLQQIADFERTMTHA
jgi:CDP-glucose 4,6-dehydratase